MAHANPLRVLRVANAQDTLLVTGGDIGAFALTTIGTATVVFLQLRRQFLRVRHIVPEKQIISRRRPLLVREEQDFEIALGTQQRVADTRRKRGRAVSPRRRGSAQDHLATTQFLTATTGRTAVDAVVVAVG